MVTTRSPTGIKLKWAEGGESGHQYLGAPSPPLSPLPGPVPLPPLGRGAGGKGGGRAGLKRTEPEAGIGFGIARPALPHPAQQPASLLTERAGVLWGALDAPVGIRLEVEPLAAEQFGDDAFELRLWRERHASWNMTSLFPERCLHLAGSEESEKAQREGRGSQGPSSLTRQASSLSSLSLLSLTPEEARVWVPLASSHHQLSV